MKRTPLKRKTPLKAKTGLKQGVGFKRVNTYLGGYHTSLKSKTGLKRTGKLRSKPNTPTNKLDGIFSKYIRIVHADHNGYVSCVTCGVTRKWNDCMDAGHFIDRQHLATRYDETNVFPQCQDCNRFWNGQIPVYTEFIKNAFGSNYVDLLKNKARIVVIDYPFEEKIMEYSERLKKLQDNIIF